MRGSESRRSRGAARRGGAWTPAVLAGWCWLAASPLLAAGDWPQFRGPGRDGVSPDRGLLDAWPEDGPKLLWTATGLGRGYASLAVVGGTIYTTGEANGKQHLVALEMQPDGPPVLAWKSELGEAGDVGYPGTRCTPTVDADRLYATTTAGKLVCVDRTSGAIAWSRSLVDDFGGRMMSGWGFSESPLVDGDRVVATPGADSAALVALDKKRGGEIWRASVPDARGAAYASIVAGKPAGLRQYVTLLGRGAVGVAANDGRLLWTYDRIANQTANIPSPIVHGDYVFTSTGYGAGAALLRIRREGRGCRAEEAYFLDGKTFQNHHGGMILLGDYIYAGAGHNNGFPTCLEFKSGRTAWRRPRGPGERSAAVAYADGHLYFRYENGLMALIEASPKGYRLKGTFKIPDVQDPSWSHPAIVDGVLYLREQDRLYAYDCRRGA